MKPTHSFRTMAGTLGPSHALSPSRLVCEATGRPSPLRGPSHLADAARTLRTLSRMFHVEQSKSDELRAAEARLAKVKADARRIAWMRKRHRIVRWQRRKDAERAAALLASDNPARDT